MIYVCTDSGLTRGAGPADMKKYSKEASRAWQRKKKTEELKQLRAEALVPAVAKDLLERLRDAVRYR